MITQQQIDRIDQQIDANRRVLMARLHVNPSMSSHAWQNAWDRCPDLHAIERALFLQRYDAQAFLNQEINRAHQAEQRAVRAKARKQSRVALEKWRTEFLAARSAGVAA